MRFCNELQPVRVQTVSEDKKWLQFKNYRRQLPCPFVIVVDIECYRRKLYDNDESVVGKTVRERELEPCAFSYLRISRDDTHPKQPTIYVGQNGSDTMQRFLECMEEEQRDVANILSQKQPIILSEKGLQNLLDSRESCHICSKKFKPSDVVVRDHCHISCK